MASEAFLRKPKVTCLKRMIWNFLKLETCPFFSANLSKFTTDFPLPLSQTLNNSSGNERDPIISWSERVVILLSANEIVSLANVLQSCFWILSKSFSSWPSKWQWQLHITPFCVSPAAWGPIHLNGEPQGLDASNPIVYNCDTSIYISLYYTFLHTTPFSYLSLRTKELALAPNVPTFQRFLNPLIISNVLWDGKDASRKLSTLAAW